jgi:NAD(P)-dependent dehydrogenase (short-subunit alcohol dehydrogenase family)
MKTLFITGVSSGLGRAFAVGALEAGHQVVGTVRKPEDVATFEALLPGRALGRQLDVIDDAAVVRTVADVESTVGAIDVVIANAGYGVEGIFEETPLSEMRAQFATNVFGVARRCRPRCPTCGSGAPVT